MPRDLVEFPEAIVQPQVPAPIDPVLATLIAARKLIENERDWMRGAYCDGDRFCALGALRRAGNFRLQTEANFSDAAYFLRRAIPHAWISSNPHLGVELHHFNDTVTHSAVVALFDKAIAARRSA